ncbi:unnamed protein product [Protopolystoma xenopodis]|uniref:Uncharacterized protein n=1 Tax=Protopolystoma xenopodis TaxID=117903 RepID=A0A448XPC0_9PLAT|nr:unnamed protein product [Protopolystoma xenopodis]
MQTASFPCNFLFSKTSAAKLANPEELDEEEEAEELGRHQEENEAKKELEHEEKLAQRPGATSDIVESSSSSLSSDAVLRHNHRHHHQPPAVAWSSGVRNKWRRRVDANAPAGLGARALTGKRSPMVARRNTDILVFPASPTTSRKSTTRGFNWRRCPNTSSQSHESKLAQVEDEYFFCVYSIDCIRLHTAHKHSLTNG